MQNELLLQITEQLSNLKDHFTGSFSSSGDDGDTGAGSLNYSWVRSFYQRISVTLKSLSKARSLLLLLMVLSLAILLHFLDINLTQGGFLYAGDRSTNTDDTDASLSQLESELHHQSGSTHRGTNNNGGNYQQQVQSELAKMNSLIYAQQNNFFQLHLGSKELQTELETQKSHQLRLMGLYVRDTLNAAHHTRQSIADAIDSGITRELAQRKLVLERESGFRLMNLKEDAYRRLNTLQKESLAALTIISPNTALSTANTKSLEDFLDQFSKFQRDFTQQVSVSMATTEFLLTQSFQQARLKMEQLVVRELDFTGFAYEDVKEHLTREHGKLDAIFRDKLSEITQEKYMVMLQKEYATLNDTYQQLVSTLVKKYQMDISYETRFSRLMGVVENVDQGNGKYVWRMNSSLLPALPDGHGYYSEKFTAIPAALVDLDTGQEKKNPVEESGEGTGTEKAKYAKLWLLRTSVERDSWKVTYEQFSVTSSPSPPSSGKQQQELQPPQNVRVQVTILNQQHQHQQTRHQGKSAELRCTESYRQLTEKRELIIDFTIPLNQNQLERRGYIRNGKIFIRAVISVVNGDNDDGDSDI